MADAVITFCGKKDYCPDCIAEAYCRRERLKECPIREVPDVILSAIDDDYCSGWDDAVRLLKREINKSASENRNCSIPVCHERCKVCEVEKRSILSCPFSLAFGFRQEGACFSKSYLQGVLDDHAGVNRDDYSAGYNDGSEWFEEQLGLAEKERKKISWHGIRLPVQ